MKKALIILFLIFACNNLIAENNQSNHPKNNGVESAEGKVPYKEILLSLLGTLSAFLIWRVQYQKDKIKDIENQLSDKKYKLYSELVYLVLDIVFASKMGEKDLTEKDITSRLLTAKRDMFLYAPDKIFKAYTKWTLELKGPNPGVDHFKTYFKMMKLVRKDMGHSSSKLNLDDFMLFLMQDEEDYKKFKEIHNW